MTNFDKIEKAIQYLLENYREQPGLFDLSEEAGFSQAHFQKIFKDWAGVSPKKFLQFISIEHAKKLLKTKQSVFDASHNTGLSGTSRLHDLFITIEGMTPGEYRNGGKGLTISWEIYPSPFGETIIASTEKGICYMAFTEDKARSFENLQGFLPGAEFIRKKEPQHSAALSIFSDDPADIEKIRLHLHASPFQLKVWQALLKIPSGKLTSYSSLAGYLGSEKASRAVGSALAENPVAYLIPCHRVIKSSGLLGEYHWGRIRKAAMLGKEMAAEEGKH
ncbi:MAG: methylated-DNA--[protein]-cysteine S-methyltransferase [Bacteroidales bacterium]|nr:methylated-DNA--[protein]-cysteine S-methyltransferase [Bacteroidales bacterium]